MEHVCSHQHVRILDSFFRRMIHKPERIYAPYVKPGMRVMDIGCGAGFASVALADLAGNDGSVVCVDLQQEMLDLTKKKLEIAGTTSRVRFHLCAADSLNVDGTFDFVNAFWMVHEVPDVSNFLRQVHSCLNPGGQFFIAEPKFHVAKSNFQKMLEAAGAVGFGVSGNPAVRLSMSVVLSK